MNDDATTCLMKLQVSINPFGLGLWQCWPMVSIDDDADDDDDSPVILKTL